MTRIGLPTWPRVLRNEGANAPGKQAYVKTVRDIYRDGKKVGSVRLVGNSNLVWKRVKNDVLRLELADILIYLIRIADKLDVDLLAAARDKIAINEERYPADKVRGDARRASEYET